jgi:type I site-specific restriction endonuclease
MYKLNLPEFDYKLKKADGKVWIFDGIRKKYVMLTPEEWVRQHIIHYLTEKKNYPKSLIKVEGGLVYNQLQKRSDIVVFDRRGEPWMVIECKSPDLAVSPSTLSQASVYNVTLKAEYITVTNGLVHYCARIDWAHRETRLMDDLPDFPEQLNEI